jgi:hypothetical protein
MGIALQLDCISMGLQALEQTHHGDHTLDAISGAGQISRPKLALVFINPTHRNISTSRNWVGIKAPWIGCNNIWKLFVDAGLVDNGLYKRMMVFGKDWPVKFAEEVYTHVRDRGLYITNIVKWAGLDARLPERNKVKIYLPLLLEELSAIKAERVILFGQLTFDAVLKELRMKESFRDCNEDTLATKRLETISSDYGQLVACYFPVGQGIKNIRKAEEILRLAYQQT